MLIVSCDPGISGAIAFLDHNERLAVHDMPIRRRAEVSKISNEVDPLALRELIRSRAPADASVIAVMESLNVFAGGSVQSMASLEATKAVIRTVFELNRMRVTLVSPHAWQKFYGIRKRPDATTKQQSLKLARELYGASFCPLAKHHGRADAILIARWAQRTLT